MSERKIVDQPGRVRGRQAIGATRPVAPAPHPNDVSDVRPDVISPDPLKNTLIRRSMEKAFFIDPVELAKFVPSPEVLKVGEAICAGLTNVHAIRQAASLDEATVLGVVNDPVAMLWISQRIEALFRCRAGIVDAALYMRAVAGDIGAIKLFFERHKMMGEKTVNVVHSGGVDVRAIPTDELAKIVADKARALPAEFRVISEGEDPKPTGQTAP